MFRRPNKTSFHLFQPAISTQNKVRFLYHSHITHLPFSYIFTITLTFICQELSHLTSLKFLPRLLLVQKHTLRILTGPPSPVNCDSGLDSKPLCLGLGTFQDKVSPDITSYIVKAGSAPSYPHHPFDRQRKETGINCNL